MFFFKSLVIPRPLSSKIHRPINFTKQIRCPEISKKKMLQAKIGIFILVIIDHMYNRNINKPAAQAAEADPS